MISSASEILSYIISGALLTFLGIKVSFFISYIIALVGSITYLIFGNGNVTWVPFMILGAKFGVSSAFNVLYLANALLFPPIIASTAFGICNIFGRLATILAPEVAEVEEPKPMIIFSCLVGIAAIFCLGLITKLPTFS